MRLVLLLLAPALAMAQVPNVSRLARGTTLSPLPTDVGDYWAGVVLDQANNCPRFSIDGQTWLPCSATSTQLAAAISGEQTARAAAISTAVAPLATATSVTTEASARAAADTALGARIDGIVNSPDTVCGTTTVTGLSIPLTGISTATTLTVAGAVAGAPCAVGGSSFLPLGAYGVCAVTAANTVQLRFQGGGLLSAVIAIPNGTYKACALVRP